MDSNIAIKVSGVSKTFRIPHEKVSSLRGAAVNVFKKSSYEEFKALDDVSFEVKKGEFFGIIGRNGSGKSTLLKILAGIYQTDKGKVHVNGLISPFLELGIGFNPELSGRDNVYLNATVLGMTKKQIDKKFDSIVQFSELERFIDQKLKNYSSGMQVRLAFSVSIHANREILLMDEVLAVGDNNFQSKCLTEFAKYKEAGKTVILVTHDVGVVQRYCDRAMLLRSGKIVKIGNAEEVGNEYIYQNMSDEERRMIEDEKWKAKEQQEQKILAEKEAEKLKGKELEKEKRRIEEEKIKQEEEKKNKVAEITKVEFLDKDGKVKNVFETGDDISIRVYYDKHKLNYVLNLGMAMYSQDGQYIFGTNTFIDEVDKEKYNELGYFQINLFNLPLKNNSYYIKAAVHGDNAFKFYDLIEKSEEFKFISKKKSHGYIEVDYKWI
jgi:lipopolysaccharide transport system ATP-binding protein